MIPFTEFLEGFWLPLLVSAVIAYLLGSVNFAIIVTKCRSHADIRDFGSGNAGATNVLRSQGKTAAALTTLGDLGKSMLAVWLGGYLMTLMAPDFEYTVKTIMTPVEELIAQDKALMEHVTIIGNYVAGLFCILGHLYPLYFGFRGGKGVMTTLGMMLILDWRVALISLSAFIVVVAIWKMVSLGSICAGIVLIITTYIFRAFVDQMPASVTNMCTTMAVLIVGLLIIKHIPNIKRILNGTESKIGSSKQDTPKA